MGSVARVLVDRWDSCVTLLDTSTCVDVSAVCVDAAVEPTVERQLVAELSPCEQTSSVLADLLRLIDVCR